MSQLDLLRTDDEQPEELHLRQRGRGGTLTSRLRPSRRIRGEVTEGLDQDVLHGGVDAGRGLGFLAGEVEEGEAEAAEGDDVAADVVGPKRGVEFMAGAGASAEALEPLELLDLPFGVDLAGGASGPAGGATGAAGGEAVGAVTGVLRGPSKKAFAGEGDAPAGGAEAEASEADAADVVAPVMAQVMAPVLDTLAPQPHVQPA
ncbi:MAG TPA: hypothetical protein VM734_26460, partial [Kofleriaceae bacterium]|nr:hypothetical protein [Kofleriaceae bacterium]